AVRRVIPECIELLSLYVSSVPSLLLLLLLLLFDDTKPYTNLSFWPSGRTFPDLPSPPCFEFGLALDEGRKPAAI
ncbi:MAG TPA: hypothetical protein VKB08_21525, partial [Bradyrhizobium sp.]|nr:hypothetical protein [Bradyrhizobium sp.]